MLPIALIKLVAVGGINTSLFNVSIMIMLPYLLMLKEIMTLMMWNKLKNLLLSRVHLNLLVRLKILMIHLMNMSDGDMPTGVYPAGRFRLAQELASGPARRRLDRGP